MVVLERMALDDIKAQPGAEVYRVQRKDQADIVVRNYKGESELPALMDLMAASLSEPYSIYTYRHFLTEWGKLALMAYIGDELVGAIICKVEPWKRDPSMMRGYIAMLAVRPDVRKAGLGRTLAALVLSRLAVLCDHVILETELSNTAALRLYEGLGFKRDKYLSAYYLNGSDAYRLKLWFS